MEVLDLPVRKREYPIYPARLIFGALRIDGLVRNLTDGGALFEGTDQLRVGTRLDLEVAGLGRRSVTVVWSLDGRSGLRFEARLD